MSLRKSVFILLVCFGVNVVAAEGQSDQKVRDAIKSIVPDAKIDQIAPSKFLNFYEVVIKGQLVYVSPDGKYVVAGSVWDTQDKKNITEVRNAEIRRTALAAVPLTKRIVFPAKKEKYIVTVFTDIDCGYCRQLHQQVAEYNNRGISLHYLFFPRAGKGSDGWKHAEAVWCSADPQAALTKAKKGEAVESKACSNPVEADYELGLQVGVSGTPAIFTADGTQIGGYIPPDQMLARLSEMDSAKK